MYRPGGLPLTVPMASLGVLGLSGVRGWLTGAQCQQMALGEPDDSGRRRPMPVEGSELLLPVSMVIVAVGTSANPLVQSSTPDLKTNRKNYIEADPETLRTSKRGVNVVPVGAAGLVAPSLLRVRRDPTRVRLLLPRAAL